MFWVWYSFHLENIKLLNVECNNALLLHTVCVSLSLCVNGPSRKCLSTTFIFIESIIFDGFCCYWSKDSISFSHNILLLWDETLRLCKWFLFDAANLAQNTFPISNAMMLFLPTKKIEKKQKNKLTQIITQNCVEKKECHAMNVKAIHSKNKKIWM